MLGTPLFESAAVIASVEELVINSRLSRTTMVIAVQLAPRIGRRSGTRAPGAVLLLKSASTGREAAGAAREREGRSRGRRARAFPHGAVARREPPAGADGAGVLLFRAEREAVHRA